MSERAIRFGPGEGLIGIVSEPDAPRAGRLRAVVMTNIGMHHRVGPFRLYVELARALAASGVCALRFDLSGMGDSVTRRDAATPSDSAQRDLVDAMDWLQGAYGIDEFVLLGLCSGVDSTHAVAARDPRVTGAIFIDGYAYPTAGYYVRHYLVRPLQLPRWVRFGRRLLRGERRATRPADGATVFERELPTKAEFRRDVRTITARGTRLLFMYTAGANRRINASRQVFEMLGADVTNECITSEFMPSADHVFSRTVQRAHLFDRVVRWVTSLPD